MNIISVFGSILFKESIENFSNKITLDKKCIVFLPSRFSSDKPFYLSNKEEEIYHVIDLQKIDISSELYIVSKYNFIDFYSMKIIEYACNKNINIKYINL